MPRTKVTINQTKDDGNNNRLRVNSAEIEEIGRNLEIEGKQCDILNFTKTS